jgi:hypothetical protein
MVKTGSKTMQKAVRISCPESWNRGRSKNGPKPVENGPKRGFGGPQRSQKAPLRSRTGPSRSQKGTKRRSQAPPGHPPKSYVDETKQSSLLAFFKSRFFRCSFGALSVLFWRLKNGLKTASETRSKPMVKTGSKTMQKTVRISCPKSWNRGESADRQNQAITEERRHRERLEKSYSHGSRGSQMTRTLTGIGRAFADHSKLP